MDSEILVTDPVLIVQGKVKKKKEQKQNKTKKQMSSKKEESKVLEMAEQWWAFYTTQNEHGLTPSGEGTMAQGLPKA